MPDAASPLLDEVDRARRFGGIARLYGAQAAARLESAHACVIGVGGVGSWAAEALARSGVGALTLIDLDHVAESNFNRQIHALDPNLGQAKVQAMAERIRAIDPHAPVRTVEDFVTPENAAELLVGFDVVVDAIDNVRAKVAIVAACGARGIPLVMVGGAGGKRDPAALRVDDLARAVQDPLLAKVRARLRRELGFPREPRKKFGIEVVFSVEPVRHPEQAPGAACAPGQGPQGLACAGYGSSVAVTATAGFYAAARAMERLIAAPAAHEPARRLEPVE